MKLRVCGTDASERFDRRGRNFNLSSEPEFVGMKENMNKIQTTLASHGDRINGIESTIVDIKKSTIENRMDDGFSKQDASFLKVQKMLETIAQNSLNPGRMEL